MSSTSAVAEMMTWMRARRDELVAARQPVNQPKLAQAAASHFASDVDWCQRFLVEAMRPYAYRIAVSVLQEGRHNYVPMGDSAVPREGVMEDAMGLAPEGLHRTAWEHWLENIRAGETKNLLDCTKEDLLTAASQREKRIQPELDTILLWREMAQRMKGKKKVRDHFTPDEIEAIKQEIIAHRTPQLESDHAPDQAAD